MTLLLSPPFQEEIVAQTDWRSADKPSGGGVEEERLGQIHAALMNLKDNLPSGNADQLTEQLLETSLERHTTSLLEAVAGVKAAVVGGTAAQQSALLDSLDKAKIPESLEKLGKNITLLSVKLDMGGASARGGGGNNAAGAAVKREAETTTSPPPPPQAANSDQLSTALTELGKDLRSQLDDVHDMVANVEETTARVLAEVRVDMKVKT